MMRKLSLLLLAVAVGLAYLDPLSPPTRLFVVATGVMRAVCGEQRSTLSDEEKEGVAACFTHFVEKIAQCTSTLFVAYAASHCQHMVRDLLVNMQHGLMHGCWPRSACMRSMDVQQSHMRSCLKSLAS
jgi:hypothetical protein